MTKVRETCSRLKATKDTWQPNVIWEVWEDSGFKKKKQHNTTTTKKPQQKNPTL